MNDEQVIRRVAETMVPFALNTNRVPDNEGGRFFRAVLRKQDWPQGIWIVSPEGKILAFHYYRAKQGETYAAGQDRWVKETRAAIEEGLKAFGLVEPRKASSTDPLKNRGIGKLPNGGVRLAVYSHGMRNGKKDGEPVVDSANLTTAEWSAFAPPDSSTAKKWTISPLAVSKLVPVLSPMTDAIFTPQPTDVTKAEVMASEIANSNGLRLIRLAGELTSLHNRDGDPKFPIHARAKLEGFVEWDETKKEIRSLLIVTQGEYRRSAAAQTTAGVIEWRTQ